MAHFYFKFLFLQDQLAGIKTSLQTYYDWLETIERIRPKLHRHENVK